VPNLQLRRGTNVGLLESLLEPDEPEKVELPSGKGPVLVKVLSRREVVQFRALDVDDDADREAYLISCSLVEPVMTYEDAQRWVSVARDDDVSAVLAVVMRISGFSKAVAKETYKSPGDDGPGVRDVPGPAAGQDANGATPGR
jgi:hypothetical protein